jgi:hypothetical protein
MTPQFFTLEIEPWICLRFFGKKKINCPAQVLPLIKGKTSAEQFFTNCVGADGHVLIEKN